jgi:hypothetical protein
MAEIMPARSAMFLGPEFNEFLFATIGAERNGGYLSVVSALARLDLDPWAEAEKLAKLPIEIAIKNLSALISAQQAVPLDGQESAKMAARLVELLPRRPNTKIRPAMSSFHFKVLNSRSAFSIFLVSFAVILAVQIMMHSVQLPPSHIVSHALNSHHSTKTPAPPDQGLGPSPQIPSPDGQAFVP